MFRKFIQSAIGVLVNSDTSVWPYSVHNSTYVTMSALKMAQIGERDILHSSCCVRPPILSLFANLAKIWAALSLIFRANHFELADFP